jgi:3,4-dihydroxy-2-butanone 4-phosphate synthase
MSEIKLNSIEDAVKDFKEGKFVIVVDDEDRENEGDLIIAAEKIDAEKVNFMLKHARGVLCAPITLSRFHTASRPGPPAHSQQARRANREKHTWRRIINQREVLLLALRGRCRRAPLPASGAPVY